MSLLIPPRSGGWHPPDRVVGAVRPGPSPALGPPQHQSVPWWGWALVGACLVVAVMTAASFLMLALVLADEQVRPGSADSLVLLSEDFATGTGSFPEFAEPGFSARAQAGSYVMASADLQYTDWVTATVPSADMVDLSASVAMGPDADLGDGAGLTVEGSDGGYAILLSAAAGAEVYRISADTMDLVMTGAPVEEVSGQLRVLVEPADGTTVVTGYLDGVAVVRYEDPTVLGGFDEVGMAIYADVAPTSARFDDLEVRTSE